MNPAKNSSCRYAKWFPYAEGSYPPTGTPFLAVLNEDDDQWLAVLTPADDDGYYYTFSGSYEFAPMDVVTHWMPLPEGPEL